jgi:hypothetical protein
MLKVTISKDSEVAKLKALGVVERLEQPHWAADQEHRPFSQRDYGHTYKTIVRGSKKRT